MMLAGRVRDTAPYGWKRRAPTLKEYFNDTIRRLRGRGLPEAEQSALESYLLALRVPAAAGASDGAVGRGKQIFESAEAGCATCHAGSSTSDGAMHDVGSGGSSRLEAFETPSLRFVGHTAPYFHDGRYLTLRALLNARDTKMGSTKHLAPHDVDALEAYLKTL
jgi:mono/diheme cytochrome c family protein